jgi:hypothetical protein
MKDRVETLVYEEDRFEPRSERANRILAPDYEPHFRGSLAC